MFEIDPRPVEPPPKVRVMGLPILGVSPAVGRRKTTPSGGGGAVPWVDESAVPWVDENGNPWTET